MYKTVSRTLQVRARQNAKRPISDRDRKINAKIAKQNAAQRERAANAAAKFETDYGYLKK